jgi:hypothetical protein
MRILGKRISNHWKISKHAGKKVQTEPRPQVELSISKVTSHILLKSFQQSVDFEVSKKVVKFYHKNSKNYWQ